MAESERELFNRLVRAHDLDVVWQDGPILSVAVGPPDRGRGLWIILVEWAVVQDAGTIVEWWSMPARRLLQQGGFRGPTAWLWRTLGREEPFHGDLVIQCRVGGGLLDGALVRGLTISAAAGRGQIEKIAVPSFFAPSIGGIDA